MPLYIPGNEPESIKNKLYKFFEKLDYYYPDKIVVGIHNKHKHLGEKLTELYRELGYMNGAAFLEAYGYKLEKKSPKTISSDDELAELEQKLYITLKERYPDGFNGNSLSALKADNQDLQKLFNSAAKYLKSRNESLREQLIKKNILVYNDKSSESSDFSKKGLNSELKNLRMNGYIYLSVDDFRKENQTIAEMFQNTDEAEMKLRDAGILVDPDSAQCVLEESVAVLKNAIMKHYGFCRMFCSCKKAETDASDYCAEIIERIHRQCDIFGISAENLEVLYEDAGITGQPAVEFAKSRLKETELSALVFDGKGKLIGCSLYEKGDHNSKPQKGTVDLIIPPGVTALGSKIFADWTSLRKVYIPDTVTGIGGGCFSGCTALRSVRLPKGLRELQADMFYHARSLKKIELPTGLEAIKRRAFAESGITAIEIPENVTFIHDEAFFCDQLKDIKISGSILNTMTMQEMEKIFFIEYRQERFKSFKLTIDYEPKYENLSDDFTNYGFAAKTIKKKRAKYACVDLYQCFRDAEILNQKNQLADNADFNQFVAVMKKSIQDTGYNKGKERFPRWLNDMTEMGYDFTYNNSFFRVRLVNASIAAVQTYSFLEQKGAVIRREYAECPEKKIVLEDIMEFIRCLRSVDKKAEIWVDCFIGGWASSFKGYSFVLNEGQFFPSYIYLNELNLV